MFAPTNNAATSNNTATRGDFEKATGFLNFYLPTTNGGRVKLGSIALKESDKTQRAVLDVLRASKDDADFESRLCNLFSKMCLEYNAAEGKAVELAL